MTKRSWIVFNALILFLLTFSFLTLAAEKSKILTPEMVMNLKSVSSVTMAPSGQNIAYIKYLPRNPDRIFSGGAKRRSRTGSSTPRHPYAGPRWAGGSARPAAAASARLPPTPGTASGSPPPPRSAVLRR